MLRYFEEMNRRLALEGKFGEIVIAGGAALALVFNARESTRDIDAIFQPSEDLRKIIKSMADDYNLNQDWLNDGVKGFMTEKMNFHEVLSYSNLSVSSVDAEGLLAMKLISARDATNDMADSVFLMKALDISTKSELFDIIEKYTHPNQHSMASKYFTMEAFEKYKQALSKP